MLAMAPAERLPARPAGTPGVPEAAGRTAGRGSLSRDEIGDLVRRMVDERMAAAGSVAGRPTSTSDRSATVTSRPAAPVGGTPPTVQRVTTTPAPPAPVAVDGDDGDDSGGHTTTSERIDEVERIVAAVERRILSELNRRSGRYGGW
jgi:hypothetical protein